MGARLKEIKWPRGVKPTKDGTIQISFSWRGVHYRERLKLRPTKANAEYAARIRSQIHYEIERGTFDFAAHFPDSPRAPADPTEATPTVTERLDDFLVWAQRWKAHSTYKGYASAVEYHLRPTFGSQRLDELKASQIRTWTSKLPISAKRINNVLIPLRHITADAYAEGLIPADPMTRVKPVKDRQRRAEPDPFSPEEIKAILGACTSTEFRAFILFAVGTGLRTSELMALRWSDIDAEGNTVRVQRALVEGVLTDVTKTAAGTRDVLLMPMALDALEAMRPVTDGKQAEIFVYPHQGRAFEGYDEVRKNWVPTVKRSGVRYRPQYQTRHTYASWLLSAGANPLWVAQQMGHADWGQIRRVYGRWIPTAAPRMDSQVEAVFAGFSQGSRENPVTPG